MNLRKVRNKYLRRFLAITLLPILFVLDLLVNFWEIGVGIFWEYVAEFKSVWRFK